jgi:hypothetical protein
VSLRRDQHIPVKKAVIKKEQLGKGMEEEEKKDHYLGKSLRGAGARGRKRHFFTRLKITLNQHKFTLIRPRNEKDIS